MTTTTTQVLMECNSCGGEHYLDVPTEEFMTALAAAGWNLVEGVFSHLNCEARETDSVPEEDIAASYRKVL
jgi:hypothetical protein